MDAELKVDVDESQARELPDWFSELILRCRFRTGDRFVIEHDSRAIDSFGMQRS